MLIIIKKFTLSPPEHEQTAGNQVLQKCIRIYFEVPFLVLRFLIRIPPQALDTSSLLSSFFRWGSGTGFSCRPALFFLRGYILSALKMAVLVARRQENLKERERGTKEGN